MVVFSKTKKAGFTLLELVVAISIMAVIASVLLGSRSGYSDQLDLRNQAYTIILAVREAQVYSLGVKGVQSGGSVTFDVPYGIHIDASNMNQYVSFADVNNNGRYDAGTDQGTVVALSNNVLINRVCGTANQCFTGPTGNFQWFDVTFKRPDLSAKMIFLNNGGNTSNGVNPPATIDLRSASGRTVTVKIEQSGQVSIQ